MGLLAIALLFSGCVVVGRDEAPVRSGRGRSDAGIDDPGDSIRFAVFGDYGTASGEEADVARLVESFEPDFLLTTGDNNYPSGDESTIDRNIGQFFHAWIAPYTGIYGEGADENRFFPSLGNHDWQTPGAAPYRRFFTLPGNERYYDFVRGPAHFFVVDSDSHEPDGIGPDSVQAQWLRGALAAAPEPFKFVSFHHPPFSSGSEHGSSRVMQWPFRAWGATAVLAGHDHTYEHVIQEGMHYFVTGLGGASHYGFGRIVHGSRTFFAEDYGALFVDVDDAGARLQFVTRARELVDETTILAPGGPTFDQSLVPARSRWRLRTFGADPEAGWQAPGFDDSTWGEGEAPIGYGGTGLWTLLYGRPEPDAMAAYFRKTFDVSDPSAIVDATLGLVRDDGAIVWLNGTEVFRSNLPEGEVGPATAATGVVSGIAENTFDPVRIAPSLFALGENVLAVEVHETSPIDEDVLFDLVLDATVGEAILPPRSTWRYDDSGTLPADDWTAPGFDDGAWAEGPAELGVGDGGEATVIRAGGTSYFRTRFVVDDPGAFDAWMLRLLRDDGAIVWLNGREVFRSNLPVGEVLPETLASFDVANATEGAWIQTALDPDDILAGENVVAVELHPSSASSADVSFDLAILAGGS